jgi:N-ethylmaleimide reductase
MNVTGRVRGPAERGTTALDSVKPGTELLQPLQVGGLTVRNRIVMSAMTRSRTPGGVPNELNALYYRQRASAGIIVAESTAVSPFGIGFADTPGIFTDEQVAGWKRVTEGVHAEGGCIFLQLWHCGHNSHPSLLPGGATPVGPSAIPVQGTVRTEKGRVPIGIPHALELEEIPGVIDEYRQAAVRAMHAGFDGVEIHAGNGYLLDQFLRDSTNRRTDRYGGPPENRMRLLLEITAAVCDVWGVERVGVRLSPTNPSVFGITDSDPQALFVPVVEALDKLEIGFLDVIEGATGTATAQCLFDFSRLRARFGGVYLANNSYTFARGCAAIREGHADMISFGRSFIANPDLVDRYARGLALNAVDPATIYATGEVGYTDYPTHPR